MRDFWRVSPERRSYGGVTKKEIINLCVNTARVNRVKEDWKGMNCTLTKVRLEKKESESYGGISIPSSAGKVCGKWIIRRMWVREN